MIKMVTFEHKRNLLTITYNVLNIFIALSWSYLTSITVIRQRVKHMSVWKYLNYVLKNGILSTSFVIFPLRRKSVSLQICRLPRPRILFLRRAILIPNRLGKKCCLMDVTEYVQPILFVKKVKLALQLYNSSRYRPDSHKWCPCSGGTYLEKGFGDVRLDFQTPSAPPKDPFTKTPVQSAYIW